MNASLKVFQLWHRPIPEKRPGNRPGNRQVSIQTRWKMKNPCRSASNRYDKSIPKVYQLRLINVDSTLLYQFFPIPAIPYFTGV